MSIRNSLHQLLARNIYWLVGLIDSKAHDDFFPVVLPSCLLSLLFFLLVPVSILPSSLLLLFGHSLVWSLVLLLVCLLSARRQVHSRKYMCAFVSLLYFVCWS